MSQWPYPMISKETFLIRRLGAWRSLSPHNTKFGLKNFRVLNACNLYAVCGRKKEETPKRTVIQISPESGIVSRVTWQVMNSAMASHQRYFTPDQPKCLHTLFYLGIRRLDQSTDTANMDTTGSVVILTQPGSPSQLRRLLVIPTGRHIMEWSSSDLSLSLSLLPLLPALHRLVTCILSLSDSHSFGVCPLLLHLVLNYGMAVSELPSS